MNVETTPGAGPNPGAGLGAVTAAVTLMGVGSVVAKAAEIDGPVLGFHRAWGAALLYGLLLLGTRGRWSLAKLRHAAPGGSIFGLQLVLFFSSVRLTTVANATMLIALQPVVVLLFFSRRFGETVSRLAWALSVFAIAGVGLVVFGSVDSPSWSLTGDLLGVGALGSWTLYFVWSKKARDRLGVVEYQAMSLIFSAVVILPIALLFSGTLDPGEGKWWWIPAMVAIPGTGHLLLNWAHPRMPLGLVSQLTLLSPVVSVAVAALLLDGESVNAVQLCGMGVVLVALAALVSTRD